MGVQETLADPAKAASFGAAFSTALVEKEAASGRTVVVKEIVPEAATVTSKTEAIVIAPTPAPGPSPGAGPAGPSPAPGPSPGTDPAPTPAPTPAAPADPAEEEEEGDNGAVIGGVVGGVVGVGVLGAAVYMFKKKQQQE